MASGFVGALALAASEAIDAVTSDPCRLKWPNGRDAGCRQAQRKVAGVLATLVDDAAIVGIGINANWPAVVPDTMADRGTAVNRHLSSGTLVDRAGLAAAILQRAIGHLEADRQHLRTAWKAQCSTLGQQVRLELDHRSIVGIAVDITADGALQIEDNGVVSTHQVGDVVHLRPS